MTFDVSLGRRTVLAAGLCLLGPLRGLAQSAPPRRPVSFEIWRQGHKIGEHSVGFQGDGQEFTVAINAELLVKIGPVPVFRYITIGIGSLARRPLRPVREPHDKQRVRGACLGQQRTGGCHREHVQGPSAAWPGGSPAAHPLERRRPRRGR